MVNDMDWICVNEKMPDKLTEVLALCEVRPYGRKYVCFGYYIPDKTLVSETGICWDSETVEHDEATDEHYVCEGWYERIRNWDEYSSVAIADFVTHWMPLPKSPNENG